MLAENKWDFIKNETIWEIWEQFSFVSLVSFSRKKIGHLERWWITMGAIYYFCKERLLNRRVCSILFWSFFFKSNILCVIHFNYSIWMYNSECVCVCVCGHVYVCILPDLVLFCFGSSGVMKKSYLFLYCLFICVSYAIYSSSISLFALSLLIPTTVFIALKFSGAKQLNTNG